MIQETLKDLYDNFQVPAMQKSPDLDEISFIEVGTSFYMDIFI